MLIKNMFGIMNPSVTNVVIVVNNADSSYAVEKIMYVLQQAF